MNPFLAAQLLLRLLYSKLTRIFFLAFQSASLPTLDNRAGGQMGRQAGRQACRGGGVRHCQWNPSGQFVLLSIIGLTWLFAHPKQSRLVAFSTSSGSTMGYRGLFIISDHCVTIFFSIMNQCLCMYCRSKEKDDPK